MANDSTKMPYILAAGAIGGAVGFLFLTEKGRRVGDSIFKMETTSAIPDKIEEFRQFIEKRGTELGDRIRGVVDRVKVSVEEGKHVYEEGGLELRHRLDSLDRAGGEVVANIHRAIDNLNRTVRTVEQSILEPIYQAGVMFKAVDSGVRRMVEGSNREFKRPESRGFYSERKMG